MPLQAQEAAAMLFRMQAPLRLCNFLCPPFHTADKDYPNIQGSSKIIKLTMCMVRNQEVSDKITVLRLQGSN